MELGDECEDERGMSLKEEKECDGVTETLREWERE